VTQILPNDPFSWIPELKNQVLFQYKQRNSRQAILTSTTKIPGSENKINVSDHLL